MSRVSNEPMMKQDEVGIDAIFVDTAKNGRRYETSAASIEELAQDIRANEQLQPVVVRPFTGSQNGHTYELVAGFRRMAAIQSLIDSGHKMKVLVRVVDAEDQGAMIANLAENLKRKDISIIDLAYAIGKLKDGASTTDQETGQVTVTSPGMTLKEIADATGLSKGNLSEIDRMRNLRASIQKKIHAGDITKDLARQLIGMDEGQQDATLAKLDAGESAATIVQALKSGKKGTGKGKKARGEAVAGETGEGGGGKAEKRALSAKAALLVMEELTAKPAVVEGEEEVEQTDAMLKARDIFKLFKRFMEGKIGSKALLKQVTAHLE